MPFYLSTGAFHRPRYKYMENMEKYGKYMQEIGFVEMPYTFTHYFPEISAGEISVYLQKKKNKFSMRTTMKRMMTLWINVSQ